MHTRHGRRDFLRTIGATAAGVAATGLSGRKLLAAKTAGGKPGKRPNILFAMADDWSWPMPKPADNRWIKTPTFDRLAREGVMFTHAYVAAPSCSPSRASIFTGQWHWRLGEGMNLWSTLPAEFPVYPDLLEEAGYHVGFTRKGWGPGSDTAGGRKRNPAGPHYRTFDAFLADRPADKPFCFWFGSHQPHRSYRAGSGVKSGLKLADAKVPACLPDNDVTRSDLCDYALQVQRFDTDTAAVLKAIEDAGELDNTIVVMSGDNGLPFPRCKAGIYDTGTRVPLAIRWPAKVKGNRTVTDFVSMTDMCPTFLEAVGLPIPKVVTGRSLMNVLTSDKSGRVDPQRNHVLTGMERHTPCREGKYGYPMRAYRTDKFLYIRNFKPNRNPAGDPNAFRDIDGGPTKRFLIEHRDDPKVKPFFELACGKRPGEELYDLTKDPEQIKNVAGDPAYAEPLKKLSAALMAELKATGDPRLVGGTEKIDEYLYRGRRPRKPAKKKGK